MFIVYPVTLRSRNYGANPACGKCGECQRRSCLYSIFDHRQALYPFFWGVTCKPCITELNTLNEVLEEWREEVDFDIVAASIDDSRFTSRARSMAQGYGWEFTCIFDKNQDLKRAMNVSLTPQTFIIDAEGNVVYAHSGYTPGSELELLKN